MEGKMTLSNAIRKRITELAKEKGISINMVATLAGIPHTTLLAFMNYTSNDPRATTLLHICEAFEIELKEFFNAPVFKEVIDE